MPGAKKAQLMTNLYNAFREEYRLTTGGSAFPNQPHNTNNERWLRIERQGNQFRMFISVNGAAGTWRFLSAQTISMQNCIRWAWW